MLVPELLACRFRIQRPMLYVSLTLIIRSSSSQGITAYSLQFVVTTSFKVPLEPLIANATWVVAEMLRQSLVFFCIDCVVD
jgi:hypothetical protein